MATKKQKSIKTHKKSATRTNCKKSSKELTNADRMHVCAVAALSITAGILLCTDAVIMSVI